MAIAKKIGKPHKGLERNKNATGASTNAKGSSATSSFQSLRKIKESKGNEKSRAYNKQWKEDKRFIGWLASAPKSVFVQNKREAFCNWCQQGLRAHKTDLETHRQTIRHQQRATETLNSKQKSLSQCGISTESDISKKIDIALAIHVTCHNSVRTIDHLSNLLKKYGVGSELEKLKLHRTKTSKLILNVIAPGLLKDLIDDLGDGPFSIIVDESTDVSCCKYMAYAIKYFSQRTQRILTNFLGFSRINSATAEQLHTDFKKFMVDCGLDIKKMIGIGTAGASNMCGCNNSLFSLLQKDQPSLQLIKCICHSSSLAASKAADELPSEVETLIKQSKNYFSRSSLRLEKWEILYKEMNDGRTPLRLVALSTTRWLSFSNAVAIILKQWNELKELFIKSSIILWQ